jgi:hypothetical protein
MAIIYMVHAVHGAKVAIDEAEAIYDEMHGWERYNPETPSVAAYDGDDEEDEVVNVLAAPKRRGRPRIKQED